MTTSQAVEDGTSAAAARGLEGLAGKYMTFEIAEQVYGLRILEVREIIRLMRITPVPRSPEGVRGVINLRGRVIPVIDLRVTFGLPPGAATEQTVIVVAQCVVAGRSFTMGLLVDRVLEVLAFDLQQIEPSPDLGTLATVDFILGVGKADRHVVLFLDIARILSGDAASNLRVAA